MMCTHDDDARMPTHSRDILANFKLDCSANAKYNRRGVHMQRITQERIVLGRPNVISGEILPRPSIHPPIHPLASTHPPIPAKRKYTDLQWLHRDRHTRHTRFAAVTKGEVHVYIYFKGELHVYVGRERFLCTLRGRGVCIRDKGRGLCDNGRCLCIR